MAIQIIRDMVHAIEIESTPKILVAVYPVLVSAEHNLRAPVCEFIGHLADTDQSLQEVVIHALNINFFVVLFY